MAYENTHRCPECRRAADDVVGAIDLTAPAPTHQISKGTDLIPPMIQAVFDIETWGLDRGWGVMLCACIMIHEGGKEPTLYTFDQTQSPTWPEKRSDDRWLATQVLATLDRAHILYAHNGERFDIKWLRTIALKYNLPFNEKKLVDPCKIAWQKYAIGSNSLSSLAQFLELSEQKMPVPMDVWRHAVLDNSPTAWEILRQRCMSDVRVLNAVAARVSRDTGMIDFKGSAWGR